MAELCEALVVQDGDLYLDDDDLMLSDEIIEACGSLVIYEMETGVVTFSHEMVQDFIKSCPNCLLSEVELAKTCLYYLLFDTFNTGPACDEQSLEDRLAKHPFARYAARYWGTHIRECREGIRYSKIAL
jgi:hypothetical protein